MRIKIKRRYYNFSKFITGSFGDLYKSEASNIQTTLVLKIINDKWVTKKSILDRFSLEYRILRQIDKHKYYPSLIAKGLHLNKPFLAYNYIDGTPLMTLLKNWDNTKFDPKFCCHLIKEILNAVEILHNEKKIIVHSDISPENILLNKDNIYLIDFGCAQYIDKDTFASKWIGKPSYLSPEQARGEKWGRESDIYQIGIIFYECLTGSKWNTGKTPNQKIVFASTPTTNYKKIPIFLKPLLRSMLETDKTKRLSNASQCLKKLAIAMHALPKDD